MPTWLSRGLWTVGLLVSVYLTVQHFTGNATLACTNAGIVNCESVTTSRWAYVFGVPVALLGLLWFVAGTVFAWVLEPRLPQQRARLLGAGYTGVGVLFVLYLVYGEISLGQICSWCTVVHVVTVALFCGYLGTWYANHA